MDTDNMIIQRLKDKDEQALSMLYDKYSGALYGVILRMCKDEGHAQNLLQDTFLTIWEKSHQYDPSKGRFYTWAYRIAKNKTLNFLRKSGEFIQTEDLSVYSNKGEETNDRPDHDELKGALGKLERHHRDAIDLVYYKGLTHKQAHKVMDVPLGTFKSYVRQALKKLQELNINVFVLLTLIDVL